MQTIKEKKFGDIMPSSGDFSLQRIGELLNETIGVVAVRFGKGNFGEYAVITLDTSEQIRSANQVVLDQLKDMKEHLDGDTVIRVKVGQGTSKAGRDFFKLVDPE